MMVDGGDPLDRRLEKWLSFRLFVVCVLAVRWRQIPENCLLQSFQSFGAAAELNPFGKPHQGNGMT